MKIGSLLLIICVAWAFPAKAQLPGDLILRHSFEIRPAPADEAEARAFLARATFGSNDSDVADLLGQGFVPWIENQMAQPMSMHRAQMESQFVEFGQNERLRVWWDIILNRPDQLRQRVAFALSEILVVSDANGALEGQPQALAEYYDILVRNAFGNFRQLLEETTLSPVMGFYLSMFRSTRFVEQGIEPDENYAREIMQLFSIGLVMLNPDGTVQTDVLGDPIPTYDQNDIVGLAEAFTGWNFAGADGGDGDCQPWDWRWPNSNWLVAMTPCVVTSQNFDPTNPDNQQPADYHVTTEKTIVGGTVLPAGQTAEQDLQQALDALFNHPNVGPFLATRLIQRLVTSNPSPEYVGRVAAVFADNGSGVRGDLGAVVTAVLTDHEVLDAHLMGIPDFGRLREPLLIISHLYRAYDAIFDSAFDPDTQWPGLIYASDRYIGQAAVRSPSVFNFFKPEYAQPGPIQNAGLVSPEFQIANETQVVDAANFLYSILVSQPPPQFPWQSYYQIQIAGLLALADDPAALVDEFSLTLMSGQMSGGMRQLLIDRVNQISSGNPTQRVTETLYYVLTSPEYLVQK